jgi:hypothetical protein
MPIDYGRLVSRTWEVFSRNRVLWLLGLIIALTSGGVNTSFNYSSNNSSEFQDFFQRYGGLLLGLGCVALIVGIIFTFIRAAGEAALIATTDHIERTHEQPSFAAAWGLGWPKMFPVWLFNLVYGILIVILILIFLVPIFVLFGASIGAIASSTGNGGSGDNGAIGGAIGLLCVCGCIALLILIPISIILGLVREYGLRAVVLENEGAFQAISTGWRMVRANPGPSFVAFLITVAVGIIASVILAPVLAILGVPMITAMGFNNGQFSLPAVVFLGALLWLVSAAIGTFTTAFESVLWTLLYRNRRQMPGGELAPVGIMPPGGGAPYGAAPPYTPAGSPPAYTPPAGSPPPYIPPQGSAPPYTPAGSPPPYTPPAASPPPYTPPPYTPPSEGSSTVQYGAPPPYTPPSEGSDTARYGTPPPYTPPSEGSGTMQYGTPPPYTPPSEGSGTAQYGTPPAYTPPPYTPPSEGSGTAQYGTPPPYSPPGETRPMEPPAMPETESGPTAPIPDDRSRGPESGSPT